MSLPPPPENDSSLPAPVNPVVYPSSQPAMPPTQPAVPPAQPAVQPAVPSQPAQPAVLPVQPPAQPAQSAQPSQPMQPGFTPLQTGTPTGAIPAQTPAPQPYQQMPGAQPYPPQGAPTGNAGPYAQYQQPGPAVKRSNPFEGLFDLRFNKFITIPLLGIVYAVGLLVACLTALFVWGSLASALVGMGTPGVFAFLVGIPVALVLFLNVLLWRVTLESIVALIRVAENSTKILEATEKIEAAHEKG